MAYALLKRSVEVIETFCLSPALGRTSTLSGSRHCLHPQAWRVFFARDPVPGAVNPSRGLLPALPARDAIAGKFGTKPGEARAGNAPGHSFTRTDDVAQSESLHPVTTFFHPSPKTEKNQGLSSWAWLLLRRAGQTPHRTAQRVASRQHKCVRESAMWINF